MTDFSDSVDEVMTLSEAITEIGGAFLVAVAETMTLADHVSETLMEVCVVAEAMTLADATEGNWWRDKRTLHPFKTRRFSKSERRSGL